MTIVRLQSYSSYDKQVQKFHAKTTGTAPGKQAHQDKDNKTNLTMNSTDKFNTDGKPKEEAQTDLNHNIFTSFQRFQEMTKKQYPAQIDLTQIDDSL